MNLNLENLNPEQKNAVETTDGPLLVLSGAGTGKTRVLVTRIAYILSKGLAMPWQVLALTFTNKAANEMKNRIADLADENDNIRFGDLWCGTFHSICLRILRVNAQYVGLKNDFLIFGEDDQKSVLKNVLSSIGENAKDASDWVETISGIKDRGLHDTNILSPRTQHVLDEYNAELMRLNAVDFGDIILHVLKIFENQPDVLMRYQHQFKYIMVDEFQDTNNAQMQLLQLLTRDIESPNICCVGDDDQSIYSWRGAEIKNILNFDKIYKNAQIIRLETNYRSTANILGAANSLIHHNYDRLGKDLHALNKTDMGEPVYILTLPSNFDEVHLISDTIQKYAVGNYSNFAILIRTGSLSRQFEDEFAKYGIPYRLIGTTKFYDRMEIRDVIAYLRLLVHPSDDVSFTRIIGKPKRGFGQSAIEKMRASGISLMDGLRIIKLSEKQRQIAEKFLSVFDFDWQSMTPTVAAQNLLEKSGYMDYWRESKDADAQDRLTNIKDLLMNVLANYQTLPEFLEHAALMTTDDNDAMDSQTNAVNIMTIHAAKGLEFDTVFLPAWEDGIFPNDKATKDGGIEEERRLAYVALTRAKRRAIVTNTISRVMFGQRQYFSPSRFISEMDSKFLEFHGGTQNFNYEITNAVKNDTKISKSEKNIVGRLVFHDQLGRGVVIENNNDILTIAFNKCGIKKVNLQYIKFID